MGTFCFELGRRRGDWGMMLRNFWWMELQRIQPNVLLMTLVAGLAWTAMLLGLYTGA